MLVFDVLPGDSDAQELEPIMILSTLCPLPIPVRGSQPFLCPTLDHFGE